MDRKSATGKLAVSNPMREIVELTAIRGIARKGVLLHMADTVRDDLRCWRSHIGMSKRLGTDAKTVRRNIGFLIEDGLVAWLGDKETLSGAVNLYRLEIEAILALPCIERPDRRAEFAAKLGRGSEPVGEGLGTRGAVVESPTNHNYPLDNHKTAEKEETLPNAEQHARESSNFCKVENLDTWIAELKAGKHG